MFNGAQPKRGDLVQTNCGDRRERTWFVIRARQVRRKVGTVPRYELYVARWWELEPRTRIALWNSAERHGGQQVISFKRYPAKRKAINFEQYVGAR